MQGSREQADELRCHELGDLAASALPEVPVSRDEWTRLERRLGPRTRQRRWLLLAPAFASLIFVGVQARRTLSMDVQGCERTEDGLRVAAQAEGHLAFDDGTRITLSKRTSGRVQAHGFRRGAHLELREGRLDLAVVHRWFGRWEVTAGPFQVLVTGTRFAVDWSPAAGRFSVAVTEGEVRVNGGPLTDQRRVHAGERLDVDVAPRTAGTVPQERAPESPPPAPELRPPRASSPPVSVVKATSRPRHARATLASRTPGSRPAPRPVELPETAPLSDAIPALRVPAPEPPAPELPPPAPTTAAVSEEHRVSRARRPIQGPQGPIWVAGGPRTIFTDQAANPDHSYVEDGLFCTRGTLPALVCVNVTTPNIECDWRANWGVHIAWRPTSELARTAATALTFEYRGRTGHYRLTAHRRGDPPERVYCVDRYRSGSRVEPSDFEISCWESGGASLRDFSEVDTFAIQYLSGENVLPFRFCLAGISLE